MYPNEGEASLNLRHATGGRSCKGEFKVAEGLNKALLAVSDCNDKGNVAVFDNDGSGIIPRDSPEGKEIRRLTKLALEKQRGVEVKRKGGVFVMPVWLMPPDAVSYTHLTLPTKA